MRTKYFSIATLIVLLSLVLTACGGAATTSSPTPGTAATTVPATAAAGTTEATAAPAATTATEPTMAPPTGEALTFVGEWGAEEAGFFQQVLDGFTAKTGIKTQYEQARPMAPVLNTRVAGGNPPDIAFVGQPGLISDLAKQGALKPLSDLGLTNEALSAGYSSAWIDLGTIDGKLYSLIAKANSKSTVWYKPDSFKELGVETPKTWAELVALSEKLVAAGKTPFAVGGQDSWTLTDWFEQIYVRVAGPEKYTELFSGKLPFTDPTVVATLQAMTGVLSNEKYVAGGVEGVLGTAFVDGIARVFGENADAEMYYEGGFVGGIATGTTNTNLKPGETIAFFTFPTVDPKNGSPVVGGGDQLVVFNDKPEVRAFLQYIISKEAQETWVKTGAIISPSKLVDTSLYPNVLAQAEAEQLGSAEVFLFDGSDLLPGSLGSDWGTLLQGAVEDPTSIETLLTEFQEKAAAEFK